MRLFRAQWKNLKVYEIAPVLKPSLEQRRVVCAHELKANGRALINPTILIEQTVGEHSPMRAEAFVNRLL
jgi:hypothetical protein